jgi:hypothetical protein
VWAAVAAVFLIHPARRCALSQRVVRHRFHQGRARPHQAADDFTRSVGRYGCETPLRRRACKRNLAIHVRQINPTGKSFLLFGKGVKTRNEKYFALSEGKSRAYLTHPVLLRGALAIVTNVGRVAVDAEYARRGA